MRPGDVRRALGLVPLPREGGWYARTYTDERSTAIYYLLAEGEVSVLHALDGPEIYHFYGGHPLQLLLLHPDGRVEEPVLGPDVPAGQRPQLAVPAGVWQGSSSQGEWTLVGTTMAPPYREEGIRFADAALAERYPGAAARIRELLPAEEGA